MCSHCVVQKGRQTWLSLEFTVFLWCVRNLTCILRVLHLQMSSWTCMSKMWSCVAKDSWKMVDVSQVLISNTITCKIHTSRLTTHVRNELSWSCSCTEILVLMSMKLELLSPLLSDSPFLSTKSFFVFPIFLPLLYFFYCISSENQNRDPPSVCEACRFLIFSF
jgi:hypothetical protein